MSTSQRTDGGETVSDLSDAMLHVRYSQAWNLSNGHDLAVLATEARRRGLPMGATASPVEGAATNPVDADFEKAKAEQERLEQDLSAAEAVLQTFPHGAIGLTPDNVRATPEWRAAKARSSKAFKALQDFNTVFVKRFAKELRVERTARRPGGVAENPTEYAVGDTVTLPVGTRVGMGTLKTTVQARVDQLQTASDGSTFYGVSWTDSKGKRRTTWWAPEQDNSRPGDARENPTTWPDAMILDAIEKHHSLTPEARARGLELGRAGYVNTHGTWKLTTKGRDALRRAEETGEDAWHDASSHRLAVANPLEVGRGTFTQHLKLHHYHGSLRITDLQNAGKRGKKVKELSVMPRTLNDAEADAILGRVADTIVQQDMTYAQAVAYLESQGKEEYRLEEHSLRGIDVEPAGVTINLEKKFDDGSIVRIESSPNDFHVVSSVPIHAPDKKAHGWRQDTIYSPKAKADGIAFYAWLKENLSKAAEMPIEKLRKTWDSLGVRYDYH